jgi:hypothetical protein
MIEPYTMDIMLLNQLMMKNDAPGVDACCVSFLHGMA